MNRTVGEALQWASSFLENHNREARVGALLLEHYTGLPESELLFGRERPLSDGERKAFENAVTTHGKTGKPYQHIIGTAPFYGREFRVTPEVLIPRQETEELMDFVRALARPGDRIADIGTGSGVLAVTLALETEAEVLATDISEEALAVARTNAETLDADVAFFHGSYLEPLSEEPVDILVSNPPYISFAEKEELDETVREYDPALALFAENDGLAAYEALCAELKERPVRPRLVAFEIGHLQGEAVRRLLQEALPEYRVEVKKDLNGRDRIVTACV